MSDFTGDAPPPPRALQQRFWRFMGLYGPYRFASVRRARLRALRARRRRRREREEARGSDRLSRPALYGIEDKLERHLGGEPGFFVEAGANDGFEQSNTYWLERFRGWRG